MKIVDLQLNIDGVQIDEKETVDDLILKIEKLVDNHYGITYEILHMEVIE